jgi:molecular chaperone GrpE
MEKEQNENTENNLSEENENTENNLSEENTNNDQTLEKDAQNLGEENEDKKDEPTEKSPEEKILELEDKLTRTFAEMENQRRRFEKEKEDAYEYGGFNFAKEALNLLDNLERSKQILNNDETLKDSEALKKTLDHLDIINKNLITIFSKNNIEPIESLNKKLDPNFHQAMMEVEDDQKEPGTIVQEIQKGFTIKDRLLRPSLVGVSKKSEKEVKKNQENNDNSEKK